MTSKMYWAIVFLTAFSIGECIDDKRALVAECDNVCNKKIQLDECCQRHGHIRGFGCSMYNKALCRVDDAWVNICQRFCASDTFCLNTFHSTPSYATCFKEKGQSNARVTELEKALEAAEREHKAYVESMEKTKKGEERKDRIVE